MCNLSTRTVSQSDTKLYKDKKKGSELFDVD